MDVPGLNFKPCHDSISEGSHVPVAISESIGMLLSPGGGGGGTCSTHDREV